MRNAYPLHFECAGLVEAAPTRLFDLLDDPARLSSHMEKRSTAMLGSSMRLHTDDRGGRAVRSVVRMEGRVVGIPVGLEEAIVLRDPPFEKRWETLGEPRLLVIGAYAMGLRIEPHPRGALLTVSIDYGLPTARPWRWLGRLLGPRYARWCCERMLKDAQRAFDAGGTSAPRA